MLKVEDTFYLYYTALCKTGEVCVAAAESHDMLIWRDLGPVVKLLPDNLDTSPICLESCLVLPYGDKYVLSYSYDHAIYVNFSADSLSFDASKSVRVLEYHLDMEKVTELDDDRWLVAFFSQIAKGEPSRLYFGVLDLASHEPRVEIIRSKDEMMSLIVGDCE